MGDQQHRAGKIGQRLYQRIARINVQMVARFVQNQQLRRVARGQRQQQPGFFTTGQIFHRCFGPVGIQTESGELSTHLRWRGARQGAGHVQDGRVVHRQIVFLVLGEIPHAQPRAAAHFPAHRFQPPGKQFCKGRFAVAVGAEQRDPVIHIDVQR